MKRKTKLFFCSAVMGIFAASSLFASAISFQVVQHDKSQDKIRLSSYQIEGDLMEYFFNAGYIVTNSPTVIANSDEDDKKEYTKSIKSAEEGECDYFVTLLTDYNVANSTGPEQSLLSNIHEISWRVIDIATGKEIASGVKKTGVVSPTQDNEDGISSFAFEIAAEISASITSKR